jgi:hypothetical protein
MEIGLAQGNSVKAHFHMAIIALKPYANQSLPVLEYKLYYACPLPGFRSQVNFWLIEKIFSS